MDLIRIRRRAGLMFDVGIRDCSVACDMAVSDGGQGAGFTPAELFAGSVGACIAMAVQGWCVANGHAGDVGVDVAVELGSEPKRVAALAVDVELPAAVPVNREDAVRRVVERCVLQETLKAAPGIDVEIQWESERSPARVD